MPRNANLKDQLTAYNGTPITYDAIGNPLSDGTCTNIWQHGRQLAQTSKDGETVSFVYNEDGLRVQKTATSTGTTKYTLHGKNIVHLTNGNNELLFFYDAQGKVAVVEYNGSSYRYVHNLQGDVVALIDGNGNKVVEYWYDAWGKPTVKTGSMAETLGTVQPFRYRGYVFDEETGLYYLRSRYYRPEWGRFVNADHLVKGNIYVYAHSSPIIYADTDGMYETNTTYEDLRTFDFLEAMYLNAPIKGKTKEGEDYTIIQGSYCLVINYGNSCHVTTNAFYHGTSSIEPCWGAISLYIPTSMLSEDLDSALLPKTVKSEYKKGADMIYSILVNFYYNNDDLIEMDSIKTYRKMRPYEKLLRFFQRKNGLKDDGIAGEKTIPLLVNVIRDRAPFNGTRPSTSQGISIFNAFFLLIFLVISLFGQRAIAEVNDRIINFCTVESTEDITSHSINSFDQIALTLIYNNWTKLCPDIDRNVLPQLLLDDSYAPSQYELEELSDILEVNSMMKVRLFAFCHPYSMNTTELSIIVGLTYQGSYHLLSLYRSYVPEVLAVICSSDFNGALKAVQNHYDSVLSSNSIEQARFVEEFGETTIQFSNLLYHAVLTDQIAGQFVWIIKFYQTYNGLYPFLSHNEWMIYTVDADNNEILEADMDSTFSLSVFPFSSSH